MIHQTVKSYRILEHLGEGSMGWAFRAEDVRDGRHVTVKFLPYELKEDPKALARFVKEANTASEFQHPNIGTIFEVDEAEDGRMFLARAFYEGEDLEGKLRLGPLPLDEALAICKQAAAGLAAAHEHGLVHRDLVPANILISPAGGVKLLDFGLSKMVSGGGLTQVGWSLGTPEYMAPEQIRGEDSSPTIDIWALGVVFYQMLTGIQPFAGSNLAQVLAAIQNHQPKPVSEVRGDPSLGRLDQIVANMMAKDPGDRYASCRDLLEDLSTWRSDSPVPATTTAPRKPLGVGTTVPASDATREEQIRALWVAGLITFVALAIMFVAYFVL